MPFASPQPYDNSAALTIQQVESIVQTGFATAQGYARTAVGEATAFLTALETLGANIVAIPNISTDLGPIDATLTPYVAPAIPAEPANLAFVTPVAPAAYAGTAVAPLSVGNAPEFTAVPSAINLPTAPAALTTTVPVLPALSAVSNPTAPTVTLPAVPALIGVTIPAPPTLTIPTFSGTLIAAPTAPANTFGFTESAYASSMLASLQTLLVSWIAGASTGLSLTVQDAIFNRGRTREAAVSMRKAQQALRDGSSRGFTKPPGAVFTAVQDAYQESQDADLANSREVTINAANLEQSNRHFAIEQAAKIEGDLITYQNSIAQRAFEAAKYAMQVGIDLYQAMVQSYAASVQAYLAQAQVFKTLIDAELSKLEVYKSELEGQRLISEINVQATEVYKAQITGVMSLIEIFKAQVEAANSQLQGNKIIIDGFAAQVTAYDSEVRAKTAEYQGYATRIQGEIAKVDLFKGQAQAYNFQVEGFKASVDAQVASKNVEIELAQRVPIELLKTNAEVFRSRSEAEASRVGALTKTFEVRGQVYDAETRGEGTRVTSEVAAFKAKADVAVAQGNLNVEVLKANIQKLVQQITLLVEATRAGAQVAAQLAAGALAGVNLSAGLHGQGSASTGYSASNSTNLSAQSSEAFNTSTQDSTVDQTVDSTATSTIYQHNITGP